MAPVSIPVKRLFAIMPWDCKPGVLILPVKAIDDVKCRPLRSSFAAVPESAARYHEG